MGSINRLIDLLDRLVLTIIRPIVILISIFIALALSYGIFARAVLDTPVFGIEELILIGAMWLYMLGAVLASRERSHLKADFIQVMVNNPRVIASFHLLATLISLFMAVMFMTWAYDLLAWGIKKGQATTVLQIPWYLSQSSLFAASILLIFYLIRDTLQDIVGLKNAGLEQQ